MYIAKTLKPLGVKVTRLAYGVPVGSDLEYADEVIGQLNGQAHLALIHAGRGMIGLQMIPQEIPDVIKYGAFHGASVPIQEPFVIRNGQMILGDGLLGGRNGNGPAQHIIAGVFPVIVIAADAWRVLSLSVRTTAVCFD